MKEFKKILIDNTYTYGWVFWLGFSLTAFINIDIFNYEYWIITIPTILLVVLKNNKEEKKNKIKLLDSEVNGYLKGVKEAKIEAKIKEI